MTIGIVEYGMGNIFSLYSLFDSLNLKYVLTSETNVLKKTDIVVLPGVGTFSEAMNKLAELDLINYLISTTQPIVGICLGMQLLFEKGFEGGESIEGLGLIRGNVDLMNLVKSPNVGFSNIFKSNMSIDILDKDFYFTHSFAASRIDANAQYASIELEGFEIIAAVQKRHHFGFQFHPELSQSNGVELFERLILWLTKD